MPAENRATKLKPPRIGAVFQMKNGETYRVTNTVQITRGGWRIHFELVDSSWPGARSGTVGLTRFEQQIIRELQPA